MDGYRLRRATRADEGSLHALFALPEVYEYLADGAAPPREAMSGLIEKSDADFAAAGLGLWLLETADCAPAGGVRLVLDASARAAELVYWLAPAHWKKGLATRMGATAIRAAFASGAVDRVFAGADVPNRRSLAVMERLGLRHLRDVVYPLGPGVEYQAQRHEWSEAGQPPSLPLVGSARRGA